MVVVVVSVSVVIQMVTYGLYICEESSTSLIEVLVLIVVDRPRVCA